MTDRACCETMIESADMELAWKLFAADKRKAFVVVQIAPAVRVSIGEKFGMARGEDAMGKVVAVLKTLGADAVADTAVAQDAVVLMQVQALEKRGAGALPVFSSDCPKFAAHAKENYPESAESLLPSATEICARALKNVYAKQAKGKRVYVIAVEACAAKKGISGADVVLTLEELTKILECTEVNLRLLKKEALDAPLGGGSGGAYICAASGGHAEAVARCLSEDKTRNIIKKLAYSGLYANAERREACMTLNGKQWKFAVVSSIEGADTLIADLQSGAAEYDFVEICGCDGGCVAVGTEACGDPSMTKKLRGLGLRYLDGSRAARSADRNPAAEMLVKQWRAMVRSGEAFAENPPICDEELFEPEPEVVEEIVIEPVAEEPVSEAVAIETEEVVAEEPAEEATVEEPVTEPVVEEVVEEPAVEEIVEEPTEAAEEVATADVDEFMARLGEAASEEEFEALLKQDPYYRRLSFKERRKKKKQNKIKR